MDGDPATEPELDAFSLILPLPYRIAVIIVLGTLPSCVSMWSQSNVAKVSGHGASIFIIFQYSKLYVLVAMQFKKKDTIH